MDDLSRRGRLNDRLRIGQADVLGGQDAEPRAMNSGSAPPSIIRASQ